MGVVPEFRSRSHSLPIPESRGTTLARDLKRWRLRWMAASIPVGWLVHLLSLSQVAEHLRATCKSASEKEEPLQELFFGVEGYG